MKFRNSKLEVRSKFEIRILSDHTFFDFRISGFEFVSDFDIRISDFAP
jgi:hypothetical protein